MIDGEAMALDENGWSDFPAIKSAIALGRRGLVFIADDGPMPALDGSAGQTSSVWG